MLNELELYYNDAVIISKGKYKGRIGLYDDDEGNRLVIYFGNMLLCDDYYLINRSFVRKATIEDLLKRRNELSFLVSLSGPFYKIELSKECELTERYKLLLEFCYVESQIYENFIDLKFSDTSNIKGIKVFISHSSLDKWFARKLESDLKVLGLQPWLDETKIVAGESIVEKIEQAALQSDYCVLILSKNSTRSQWVRREWESAFVKEIKKKKNFIIPILLEQCKIPTLLLTKKYADFTKDYNQGLSELLRGLNASHSKKTKIK